MDSASPETGKQMTRRSPAGNAGKVCHHARVEHRIDLDQVAALISGHAAAWAQADPVAEAPGAHDPMHLSDIEQLLERFASLFP